MKRVLVLSGGGARGAFQVGALHELYRNGLQQFDAIVGTSVGALNGALVAQGKIPELVQVWDKLYNSPELVYNSPYLKDGKFHIWGGLLDMWSRVKHTPWPRLFFESEYLQKALAAAVARPAVLNMQPLQELIDEHIIPAHITADFMVGVTSLRTGEVIAMHANRFSSDYDLKLAILASTVIPVAMPPVPMIQYLGKTYSDMVDGGIRTISPLGAALDWLEEQEDIGPEPAEVLVINCNTLPAAPDRQPNLFANGMRTIEIMKHEILQNDIALAQARAGYANINVISPEFALSGTLDFSAEALKDSFDAGRQKIKNLLGIVE